MLLGSKGVEFSWVRVLLKIFYLGRGLSSEEFSLYLPSFVSYNLLALDKYAPPHKHITNTLNVDIYIYISSAYLSFLWIRDMTFNS